MKSVGRVLSGMAALAAGCLFIVTCGGGGGGGGGIQPAIPYEGVNTPAYVTSENAVGLATEAWLGMQYIQPPTDLMSISGESSPAATRVSGDRAMSLAGAWEKAAVGYLDRHPPLRAAPLAAVEDTIGGDCWGYGDVTGTVDVNRGRFDLTVTYHDYSDDCVLTLNGRSNIKGKIDLFSLSIQEMTVTFEAVAVSGEGVNVTQSGVWSIDYSEYPTRETLDMVTRDEDTGKTVWMRDWEILTSPVQGTAATEMEIAGLFYEPDMGYVAFSTVQPLRIDYDDAYPYEGAVVLSGAGNTGAWFQVLSNAAYRVTCDEDGDGQYDDFDTGVEHWPGMNNLPAAEAGTGQEIIVACGVSLNGAGSDPDGDPLEYYWQFLSTPEGSQAALTGENLSSPSFTPDLLGDYVVELTVDDGMDISLADSVTITVIDGDFCTIEHIETGSRPEAVAVGDVDGDAGIEVLMTTSSGNLSDNDYSLLVFTRSGSGLVGTPSVYPAGDGVSVAIGDVNDDGRNDVVVTVENGIGIFYQNSSGELSAMNTVSAGHSGGATSRGVAIGDLNHDGYPDICYLSAADHTLTVDVFTQKTDGTLNLPAGYEVGYSSMTDILALGDVNGDSRTDIVVSSGSGTSGYLPEDLNIFYQNGSGTMDSAVHIEVGGPSQTPTGLAVGDLSADGRADVALQFWYPSSQMTILYQNLSGQLGSSVSFASPFSNGLGETPLQVTDLDGDGRSDLVGVYQHNWSQGAYGYEGATVALAFQQGNGTLGSYTTTSPSVTGVPYNPYALGVGDVDDDGKPDVVFANPRLFTSSPGVPGLTVFSGGKW